MNELKKYKKKIKAMKEGYELCNAYGFKNKREKEYTDIQEVKAPTLLYGCMRMLELLGFEWVYSHTDKGIVAKYEKE